MIQSGSLTRTLAKNDMGASQPRKRPVSGDATKRGSRNRVSSDNSKPSLAEHQHDECGPALAAKKDQRPGAGSVRYRVIVHSYRTRLIDPSNASVKQIEDCLTPPQGRKSYGIGIIPDDSPKYCDQPIFLQTKVGKGEERTEIEVLRYLVN